VLHDLDHAARVADRLLLLSDGRVLAEGAPVEVLTAEHIEAAYGLRVEVAVDERTGRLRIDPVSRHSSRLHDPLHPTPARSREDTEE
jgi:iron complex transport system ATP-binding protein